MGLLGRGTHSAKTRTGRDRPGWLGRQPGTPRTSTRSRGFQTRRGKGFSAERMRLAPGRVGRRHERTRSGKWAWAAAWDFTALPRKHEVRSPRTDSGTPPAQNLPSPSCTTLSRPLPQQQRSHPWAGSSRENHGVSDQKSPGHQNRPGPSFPR